MMPVELLSRLVSDGSPEGGTVYDPFLGSGTALVAAESLRRVCYAMEIESKYAAVCLDRMQRFGLEPHLLAG